MLGAFENNTRWLSASIGTIKDLALRDLLMAPLEDGGKAGNPFPKPAHQPLDHPNSPQGTIPSLLPPGSQGVRESFSADLYQR